MRTNWKKQVTNGSPLKVIASSGWPWHKASLPHLHEQLHNFPARMDWIPFETVIQNNWYKSISLISKVTDTISFLALEVIISYQSCQCLDWLLDSAFSFQWLKCSPCSVSTCSTINANKDHTSLVYSRAVILCLRGIWQSLQIFLVTATGSKEGMLASSSTSRGAVKILTSTQDSSHLKRVVRPEMSALLDWESWIQRYLFWFAAKTNLKIIGLIKKKINCNQLGKTAKISEDGK